MCSCFECFSIEKHVLFYWPFEEHGGPSPPLHFRNLLVGQVFFFHWIILYLQKSYQVCGPLDLTIAPILVGSSDWFCLVDTALHFSAGWRFALLGWLHRFAGSSVNPVLRNLTLWLPQDRNKRRVSALTHILLTALPSSSYRCLTSTDGGRQYHRVLEERATLLGSACHSGDWRGAGGVGSPADA